MSWFILLNIFIFEIQMSYFMLYESCYFYCLNNFEKSHCPANPVNIKLGTYINTKLVQFEIIL